MRLNVTTWSSPRRNDGAQLTAAVPGAMLMGCQFHPEKSGTVGLTILKTFCEGEW